MIQICPPNISAVNEISLQKFMGLFPNVIWFLSSQVLYLEGIYIYINNFIFYIFSGIIFKHKENIFTIRVEIYGLNPPHPLFSNL